MAYKNNQQNSPLPTSSDAKRSSVDFLPSYFRTQANKKILSSTIDQMVQPGVAEKISGYFGRKTAKSFRANDTYIEDVSDQRQNRQLEPAVVVKDDLNNVKFFADYPDFVNQIANFSGNTDNHSKLNSQEFYSWNPNIDWDKFVNFREYYWMPNGPQTVSVFGQSKDVVSTYTVTVEEQDDNFVYKFSPPGFEPNPSLRLFRGQKYRFEINTPEHPISFSTNLNFADTPYEIKQTESGLWLISTISGGDNESSIYVEGVKAYDLEGNEIPPVNIEEGVIEFEVALNAPDRLYYASQYSINTSGLIKIDNIETNTEIDVTEIIGKKSYTSANGVEFTNGLKIRFIGDVTPVEYANKEWYIEGVGSKIVLVDERNLIIPASYSSDVPVPFDSAGFDRLPFGNANSYAANKDYIVINRASVDRNPWTRYNRWFHKDVLRLAARYNSQIGTRNQTNQEVFNLDQTARASRPIIEFEAGLKLHNFGTSAKQDIDLIDNITNDAFSIIEGSTGYNIDGVDLAQGMRVIFAADPDILVRGKIYEVNFILHNGVRKISLLETEDTIPQINETILIKEGSNYRGKLFWFNGDTWVESQQKTQTNQAPLFDMFDKDGVSFSDTLVYNTSSFTGNKVFAYIEGTQEAVDSELGFPLTYRSIENFGDISFEFPLISNTFTYQIDNDIIEVKAETGYLRKYESLDSFVYQNGWTKANRLSRQAVIRQYVVETQTNDFAVDVFDRSGDLNDLRVKVILNNEFKNENVEYFINRINGVAYITFNTPLSVNDNLVLKCYSSSNKNDNGYYEIAHNLERNPLNTNMTVFTLGEVIDHVSTIVENSLEYNGNPYPGASNLRDIGNLDSLGTRFVKHSGPLNLAMYHMVNKDANIIKALKFSRSEYAKFKRLFIQTAENLGYDGPVKQHVDLIMSNINAQKTERMPFYFTDMVPVGGASRIEHIVRASDSDYFAMSVPFNLDSLSAKAVLVYLNGIQLTHGKDYTFNDEGFVRITATKAVNDIIEIYEYDTTDGCFVPSTPTKLGLYPKFEPQIYVDNTTLEPRTVIQGHDGSITLAYGDFRDQLILELERRIFNNIKQAYRPEIINIHDFVGGFYRDTGFSKASIDRAMTSDFIQWNTIAGDPDYTSSDFYQTENGFTYNYSSMSSPTGQALPGFWRGVYRQAYDTDRPHTHPWEMLGFSIMPAWWEEVYGPAPYTSANLVLWEDLEQGVIREPGIAIRRNKKYVRPGLLNHIPVDEQGNLLDPLASNFAKYYVQSKTRELFKYGDETPVESAWRKTSEYPFALITAWALHQPAKIIGLGFDLSRIEKNVVGNLVYSESNVTLRLSDLVFPNTIQDNVRTITSGLVNYIYNYFASSTTKNYEEYQNNLRNLTTQLAIKVGGFTEKSKFKLILDSRTPLNEGNVFVPSENYQIFLNTSAPIQTLSFSGVIIEKATNGFVIKGYDREKSLFQYMEAVETQNDPVINVGGVSENFVDWDERKQYIKGQNVRHDGLFYRVVNSHISSTSFNESNFVKLASLPQVGGRDAVLRKSFTNRELTIPYSTVLRTVQEVVDFILGYQEWLIQQGFKFEYFNEETGQIENWNFSVKEFLFWTTQNWAAGSVITLSPGAQQLLFSRPYVIVDNIFDNFYDYTLLKADGKKLDRNFSSIARDNENDFGIKPKNTADGIYAVKLPLVQKEHVVLLDNKTVFNDYIYDPEAGYRQERIKVSGYRSDNWNGGLNIPGFIYDSAEITDWEPWKDYGIGSLVKYKEFYYVALGNLTGVERFNSSDWERLEEKPESKLYPNFDYKINQFADFYDLDSDNFDSEQQKHAQHLIGYQKRQYLQNIINDDVSQFKFYQGFIQDKGTKNSLTKLFDALSAADKDSLEFYEEWAIRIGRYGATDNYDEVEYIIDEKQLKLDPQPIELVDSIPLNDVDLTYKLKRSDLYSGPKDYNHAPFPVATSISSIARSAGYVADQDVSFRVQDKVDLVGTDISAIGPDDYIWTSGLYQDWSVLQLVTTEYRVIQIETQTAEVDGIDGSDTPNAIFYLDRTVGDDIKINDVIGLSNVETRNQGFFEVDEIVNNRIRVAVADTQSLTDVTDINGYLSILRNVRAKSGSDLSPIEAANSVLEHGLLPNQRLWIDGVTDTKWKVLQKSETFKDYYEILNPDNGFNNNFKYSSVIAVNRANTLLLVSDPTNGNGKVHFYSRPSISSQFKYIETLEPNLDQNSADPNQKFGSDLAISQDGEILVIGSSAASSLKTNLAFTFDSDLGINTLDYKTSENYAANSIVKWAENYWSAVRDVVAENNSVTFTTFDSYAFIEKVNDSSNFNLLLQGSPYLANEKTDHILIRAPYDQYRATKVQDKVVLKWNLKTNFNRDIGANTEIQPFEDNINSLNTGTTYKAPDANFITGDHEIKAKIDRVILITEYGNPPEANDVVSCSTGSGTVHEVFKKDFSIVLYIKNINGEFAESDQLYINDALIGTYTTPDFSQTPTLGGWWYINTAEKDENGNVISGFEYYTSSEFVDITDFSRPGYGLVYQDIYTYNVDQGTYSRTTPNYYYNILDYLIPPSGSEDPIDVGFMTTLSHIGDAYFSPEREILDSRWLVRLPKPLDNVLTIDDYINIWIDDDADPVDELLTGFNSSRINIEPVDDNPGAHKIVDIWDGYIDFRQTQTQKTADIDIVSDPDTDLGDFYEPAIGDIVEDGLSGAFGEVAYYIKRNISDARVYLKNVSGTFTLLENLRLRTLENGVPNKYPMGQIRKVSMANTNIGKLAVFQESAPVSYDQFGLPIYGPGAFVFPANPNSYGSDPLYADLNTFAYVNKEYWIYQETFDEAGANIPASIPSTSNKDWNLIYNIPVIADGLSTSVSNKGAYSIYRRAGSSWQFVNTYTLPTNDTEIGKTVDVINDRDLYRIYVGSKERVNFIKHGLDIDGVAYNYALDINPNYRGEYNAENLYRSGEIVKYTADIEIANIDIGNDYIIVDLGVGTDWNELAGTTGVTYTVGTIFTAVSKGTGTGTGLVRRPVLYKALTFNNNVPLTNKIKWQVIEDEIANSHYVPIADNIYNNIVFDSVDTLLDLSQDFAVSGDGQVFATSIKTSKDVDADNKIVIYRLNSEGRYTWSQTIVAPLSDTNWGASIDMSSDGTILVIGDSGNDTNSVDNGAVFVYKINSALTVPVFELAQTLHSPRPNKFEKFGTKVSITDKWIAVSSYNGDIKINTTFDEDTTIFDRKFTTYSKQTTDSGSVTLYQEIDGDYLIAEELEHPLMTDGRFGENVLVNGNEVYVGVPRSLTNVFGLEYKGSVINYSMPKNSLTWEILRQSVDVVDLNKIKHAFLYNVKTNELVTYLDYIDPVQGKIAGAAEQEITFKSYNDLARYNATNVRSLFSETNNWESEHVGKLWWDLSTARFKNAYFGDPINQTNRWNKVVPSYSIDVYEWVESNLAPAEWDAIADTPEGYAQGISGQSKYSNDAYSQKLVYDPVSQTFGTKFYFWVKNKFTVPAIEGRSLSAGDVARLVADPVGQGYKFVALLSNRRFALFNCEQLISDTDVALNVGYYTLDNIEQNSHSEFQIISEGLETSVPKNDIEQKWIDSLVGYDKGGRPVPDPELAPRQRYGTLNKPRQSWFVNRKEALKQFVERANIVLSQNIVVDEFNFDRLNSSEAEPLATERLYDYVIDTVDELKFVGTVKAEPAILNLTIKEGTVTKVSITNRGRSYVDPTYIAGVSTRRRGPSYTVIGKGEGLELDLTINNLGQVTSVDIINGGTNYEAITQVVVRRLSVLVKNDSTVDGRWSIYQWNENLKTWQRTKVQSYNTPLYWSYTDWYAEGYNQFTTVDYVIESSYQLTSLNDKIGNIVKILSIGSGGWLLLKKVANVDSRDYTVNYETIGRQNGTIELSSRLYDVAISNVGFDAFAYDSKFFDSEPIIETRQILEAIKEDLFVDNLAVHYNELFFASIRYVLSEQFNVDWVFKTSFVKAKHNVGDLEQKITYQNDNLPSYNSYIEEVKPYKTNIREYLSAYERVEDTNTLTTDFDVPPIYDKVAGRIIPSDLKVVGNQFVGLNERFNSYPDKNWLDNVGFEVTEIAIYDAGAGYSNPPVVYIEGGGGEGATARAYIGKGKITRIEVTNPGKGYIGAPAVRLVGSVGELGREARVSAIIGNSVVPTFKVISKFDRVSGEYFIVSLSETQTFTGTAINSVFNLKWPMELKNNRISVYIDNEKQLRSKYSYNNIKDTSLSYTRYLGQITFAEPPALDAQIVIEYHKDPAMLQSADRIKEFYKPVSGMPGIDLGQLMTGVDYGGVEVRSFDFDGPAGWDTDPWYTEPWDTYDNTYEDILFVADGSTAVIALETPLEDAIEYNVYRNGIRIDDLEFNLIPTNPNAEMQTIIGDGVTQLINLTDYGIETQPGDRYIIRKSTSDGSFLPDSNSFDTLLQGGNLEYGNASGVNAEDIIVDGDLFVTPVTSAGPEELVPGQILDTVDIKVYERFGEGQGQVYNQNYITDGTTVEYDLGLFPNSDDAVIVKLGTVILASTEYTIDRASQTLTFNTAPTAGQRLTILSVGQNGQNIIDIGTIIADGSTNILTTKSQWADDLQIVITVNGKTPEPGTVLATSSNEGFVVFEFASLNAPAGTRLDYEIYANKEQQNYSKIVKDTFVANGSSSTYDLTVEPLYKGPAQYYTIVEVNNRILSSGYNIQFTVTNALQLEYELEKFQVPVSTIDGFFLKVYLNDELLEQGTQYLINVGNSSIILDTGLTQVGDEIEIFLTNTGEYSIDGTALTLSEIPAENEIINVYTFTNHDVTGLERYTYDVVARSSLTVGSNEYTRYHNLRGGKIELVSPAVGVQYVWVIVDGEWLAPTVDYELSLDNKIVYLKNIPSEGVTVDVLHFAKPLSTPRIAWRQFKDILNRTHYKRVDNDQGIVLAQDLNNYDLRIEVINAANLPDPDRRANKPGIIFIEGERIEYFVKDGNTLRQLRRGTLGTGIGQVYTAGTTIVSAGSEKNIPYKDQIITLNLEATEGQTQFALDFTPNSVNEFEVFAAGRRLRKTEIAVFDPTLALDSPEGDVVHPAEFTLNGTTLVLAEGLGAGQRVTVVRRVGKLWNEPGTPLKDTQNDIGNFLRQSISELPE